MTRLHQLQIASALLATGLVRKVYHSCQLVQDAQSRKLYAAYKVGEEYQYAGVDDTQGMFAYIRTNGPYSAQQQKVSGCDHVWEVSVPLRVVIFSDHEDRDFGYLLTRLAAFTTQAGVWLLRILDDKWQLLREESDLTRSLFDGKTFYVAFDVLVKPVISQEACEHAACPADPNPMCL